MNKEQIIEEFEERFCEHPATDDKGNVWWVVAHRKSLEDFISSSLSSLQESTESRVREELRAAVEKQMGEICYSFKMDGRSCNDGHEGFEDILALLRDPKKQ